VVSARVDDVTTAFDAGGNISVKASANLTTPNIGAATGTSVSVTANVTGGNIVTSGLITATGNATAGNVVTAGLITATGNATAGNVLTAGIMSSTGNAVHGNILTAGLISATSTITSAANVIGGNITTVGLITATGNVTGSNILTAGLISATSTITSAANVTGGNILTAGLISATGNATAGNIATAGLITATGNVQAGNIRTAGLVSATGNVTGNYFIGNGSALTGITLSGAMTWVTQANTAPSNVAAGSYWYDSYSGVKYQYTNDGTGNVWVDQSFPTSFTTLAVTGNATIGGNLGVTGTLTYGNISTTGNVDGGNLRTSGVVTATGNITGGNVVTAGIMSSTGNVDGANLRTTGLVTATGNVTAGNILTAGIMSSTGNAIHGNILTSGLISATGNAIHGNILTSGLISATGNVFVSGSLGIGTTSLTGFGLNNSKNLTGATTSYAYNTSSVVQSDVTNAGIGFNTFIGTQAATFTLGSIRHYNATQATFGANSVVTNQYGFIVDSTVANATNNYGFYGGVPAGANNYNLYMASAANNYMAGNILTAGIMSSTGNAIHGNILTAGLISATGNITAVNLTVGTGTVTLGNIVNANGNGVGNVGSSSLYFNTIFAKATSAQYADLAEMYCADKAYEPGTVIEFGGVEEVTITTNSHSPAVAGIVSTNPSYLMNATLDCVNAVQVALTGRVPCQVIGTIHKGDRLVASDIAGVATVLDMNKYEPGCIIGKALENYNSNNIGVIEVAVGRT
jgi:hypothetical protein